MEVCIIHPMIAEDAAADEQDIMVQVLAVKEALEARGHCVQCLPITLNFEDIPFESFKKQNAIIFNLMDSLAGSGRLLHLVPALLEHHHIRYTGCRSQALYLTTDKLLTKKILSMHNISTPDCTAGSNISSNAQKFSYPIIIKPVAEDASVGLDDNSIIGNSAELQTYLDKYQQSLSDLFAESFIAGREFNVSILEVNGLPVLLPIAEIQFKDFPAGKPQIVGYKAKWQKDTFEYIHTVRSFPEPECEPGLMRNLEQIALTCWKVFELRGYARVDFRGDQLAKPWVLEINANPCIAPDAGFIAAAGQAGFSYPEVISNILKAAGV